MRGMEDSIGMGVSAQKMTIIEKGKLREMEDQIGMGVSEKIEKLRIAIIHERDGRFNSNGCMCKKEIGRGLW